MGVNSIQLLALLGFLISYYAYTVERKMKASKKYVAACDISKQISCMKAFKSKYGHLAGFSNAVGGMVFYAILYLLTLASLAQLIFIFAMLSFVGSLYLAYVSYIKLRNFCLVCTTIYLINFLLLIISYGKM